MSKSSQIPIEQGPYRVEDYRIGESVGYLIKRVRAALGVAVDREMAAYDVSNEQWTILLMLSEGRYETAAELARGSVCDTGSMTRMLDRLEAKGLVQRKRCAEDRRVVRIALSEAGRSLADILPDVMVKVLNAHLAGFSSAEFEQLKSLLRRMLDNAESIGKDESRVRAADGAAAHESGGKLK